MAFVRIGQFRALPDTTERVRDVYEAEAIPAIRAAKGNISAVLLQQHQARDTFMAITVWSTAEDAERYERRGGGDGRQDPLRLRRPAIAQHL
ncbi:antibiotic biosynthesis monooxygenase [Mesorhizobium sp. B2-3-11]|uniref:putative quinol monooxygenase n=1 Tax=Mesorhizobium sp. B2-3-11 TaxID=2589953 RepID=UPI001AEDD739|nr:antibiotic biosynthesis monooxygenase [Mesorhizobium sp. B2-3-11]